MARKPNYAFERNNRAKAKAAKREAKRQAKHAARSQASDEKKPDDDGEHTAESREDEVFKRLDLHTISESG